MQILADLANATGAQSGTSLDFALTLIIAAVAVVISIFAVRYQSKQYKLSALVQAFNVISDKKQIEARGRLQEFYENYKHTKSYDVYERADAIEAVNTVRNAFELLGVLYTFNAVPRRELLEMYWYVTIQSWLAIKPYVDTVREAKIPFAKPFEILYEAALAHHKEYYKDVPLTS